MIDRELLNQLAYLDSVDKLIESKMSEYLNPEQVLKLLTVDYTDINNLLYQQSVQSSNSLFYNAIAARLRSLRQTFEDTVFERYMSHCRRYAGLFLDSLDKRGTKELLNDYVIYLFSNQNTDINRYSHAKTCYIQYLINTRGKKFNIESHMSENKEEFLKEAKEFYAEMYSIDKFYEDVIELRNKFKYRMELAEGLADASKQVTICASNIVKLKLTGTGDPARVTFDTIDRIRNMVFKNPQMTTFDLEQQLNGRQN